MTDRLRVVIMGEMHSVKTTLAVLIGELLANEHINVAIEDPENRVTTVREFLSHPSRRMQLIDMLRTKHIVIQEVKLEHNPPVMRPVKEPWWKRLLRRFSYE